jgi:hypothetical protein
MGKTSNAAKHPAFTATCDGHVCVVRAKGPEQAAMKVFRMNKATHAAAGYVDVCDQRDNLSFRLATSRWCSPSSPKKFLSKPIKP